MVFPVVMYGCESWTIKKAECQRIDAFELWCWRRLLRIPPTASRSNQSILEEISLNIHWEDWCWSWNSNTLATWCKELTHWKRPWCWEKLKALERLKKEPNYGCWIRRGWANCKRFRGGKNLKNSEGCCIQVASWRSRLLSFIGPYRGNFRWCLESNAYVGKTTQKSKRDTHTIILALHQKVSNVIDLDISSVQFSHSVVSWLFATPWTAARQTAPSITNSWSLLKSMFIESVCHPTISSSVVPFSSCPQSFPASGSF